MINWVENLGDRPDGLDDGTLLDLWLFDDEVTVAYPVHKAAWELRGRYVDIKYWRLHMNDRQRQKQLEAENV
jgi:hypothetical protein